METTYTLVWRPPIRCTLKTEFNTLTLCITGSAAVSSNEAWHHQKVRRGDGQTAPHEPWKLSSQVSIQPPNFIYLLLHTAHLWCAWCYIKTLKGNLVWLLFTVVSGSQKMLCCYPLIEEKWQFVSSHIWLKHFKQDFFLLKNE